SSDNTVILDTGTDTTDLSSYTVAPGLLAPFTGYSWKVRYQDSVGWSDYSTATDFTTIQLVMSTLSASAGSISRLSPLTLTAGNITALGGDKVKAVIFFIDNNFDGSFDKGDRLLGRSTNGKKGWSIRKIIPRAMHAGEAIISAIAIGAHGPKD